MSRTPARHEPELTLAGARALHLHAQGVLHGTRRPARRADVPGVVERMRLLQIDTIHVVARSPYLVLYSRLGHYPMDWLDAALAEGVLAETWAHEACMVPSADMPDHIAYRPRRSGHWAHRMAARVHDEQPSAVDALIEHVRAHGPVRAADVRSRAGGGTGWWQWSTEKRALEAAFARGDLLVSHRERFQRFYDLAERVQARWRGDVAVGDVDPAGARRRFVEHSVKALGLARCRWVGDYFRLGRVEEDELHELADRGRLIPCRVRGRDQPFWVHRDHAAALQKAASGKLRATRSTPLSPFDPVVWDRQRASELFDFDYALECYLPARKRRYGYFVLPWLHRGRLVGRMDAKAHRRDGVFEVRSFHLEDEAAVTDAFVQATAQALRAFAVWHGTSRVVLGDVPRVLARPLAIALR